MQASVKLGNVPCSSQIDSLSTFLDRADSDQFELGHLLTEEGLLLRNHNDAGNSRWLHD